MTNCRNNSNEHWDMTPCHLAVGYLHFGGACWRAASSLYNTASVSSWPAVQIEIAGPIETQINCESAWRHISDYFSLHQHATKTSVKHGNYTSGSIRAENVLTWHFAKGFAPRNQLWWYEYWSFFLFHCLSCRQTARRTNTSICKRFTPYFSQRIPSDEVVLFCVYAKEESESAGLPKSCKSGISNMRTAVRMRPDSSFFRPSQWYFSNISVWPASMLKFY
jgi:hypothetical protein